MQEVAKTQKLSSTQEMLEEIRLHHIDIHYIIQKELQTILPKYIAEIIISVFNLIKDDELCQN